MPRFNAQDLDRITSQPGYAVEQVAVHPRGPRPAPILEHRDADAPPQADKAQEAHPVRLRIRVTDFRVRLLDDDNACEKFHVDALRYAQVISEDRPPGVRIVTTQEKVKRKTDERTEITIERI